MALKLEAPFSLVRGREQALGTTFSLVCDGEQALDMTSLLVLESLMES